MSGPSRRTLARRLESVEDFDEPSAALEQYLTPSEIAAHVCHLAGLQGDLDSLVIDLGTGTGMLAIGAALAGADRVVGIDVDAAALVRARKNATQFHEAAEVGWLCADATRPPLSATDTTVLSNPPFGAQRGNRHADRDFLEVARALADVSYTIHNQGSQAFVESFADDAGATVTHAFRAPFPIENRFAFHTADVETVQAEVFRIEWP
jgi:putative methylase